jgi:hypothetical protein
LSFLNKFQIQKLKKETIHDNIPKVSSLIQGVKCDSCIGSVSGCTHELTTIYVPPKKLKKNIVNAVELTKCLCLSFISLGEKRGL